MELYFMRGSKLIAVTHNAIAVPRVGDMIAADNCKVPIKEVIWHLDNTTWVEIQV